MPEYLAPGVYVEEIDTGSKPIEGVSTSTAGMVGVAERGPVNVPILVTSFGEYRRWFGERLNPLDFVNPADPSDLHCYLPHAVEGFFTNGGKRLYVTRVQAPGAARAAFPLLDRGSSTSAATWLLRPAPELSGHTAATAAYVVNVNALLPNTGTLSNGDHVRVGRGSESEFRDLDGANGVGAANHVTLEFPLARSHAAASIHVNEIQRSVHAIAPQPALATASAAGATTIDVQVGATTDLQQGHLIEIGNDPLSAEHRFVTAATTIATGPNVVRLTLDSPLQMAHGDPATTPPGINVTRLDPNADVAGADSTIEAGYDAGIGDRVVYLTAPAGHFTNRADLVVFDRGNADQEARRIGRLSLLQLAVGPYDNYEAGSPIVNIGLTAVGAARALTGDSFAGANVLNLDNRVGIVASAGMVLQIGAAAPFEYAEIVGAPNRSPGLAPPDAGMVQLATPLLRSYPSGTQVLVHTPAVNPNRPANVVALPATRMSNILIVTDGGDGGDLYSAGDVVRVTTLEGEDYFHELTASAAVAEARPIILTLPFERAHAAGSPVAERAELVNVQAIDTGAWGNRLRVSVSDENPGLVSRTPVVTAIAPNRMRLDSAAGVEAGTILELVDPNGALLTTVKVMSVERATAEVTLDSNSTVLSGPQIAALNAVPRAYIARSREFRITVRLLAPPDPSIAGSADRILDSEIFRNLSMDPRHSRYVETVIGAVNGPPRLSDRRPDGESWYVRVDDVATTTAAQNAIRVGPEALTDLLKDGREQPARHPLEGGTDSMATINPMHDDSVYVGTDDANPENRTGLFSLANVEEISIVAAPGRTSAPMQNALINHCETDRYRFAVLDANRPPQDSIADVVDQRNQYDTKYAALYHPWLLIPPPFPQNAAQPDEYPIPPSGHVVGVYARTDIDRGVHKAPANEVVSGITGLRRVLNKSEQDMLNPYPVNVNVIRDFRRDSRGIRVYGARVITSDSDWKYVNVRRLLIFIEASLNRGLQWVTFEPNAEPLWARVRRSIENFLTLVWRNGALEGTKVEEAFFVKCDRTTMTQTDIDSGRLICVVGVAPVKPAEFVIVRIGLWTAHSDS